MIFVAKLSLDIFQMSMDIILVQCPGGINIHNNVVIFRVSNEDHDANLINLLNVCQKEDLSIKKLELQRVRMTFFRAEYSAEGMDPHPKKVQEIVEMTLLIDK